jgi:hypothetical protein
LACHRASGLPRVPILMLGATIVIEPCSFSRCHAMSDDMRLSTV